MENPVTALIAGLIGINFEGKLNLLCIISCLAEVNGRSLSRLALFSSSLNQTYHSLFVFLLR